MDNEMIKRVSKAIVETPNASDYESLVAINAIKAMREPTDKILGAIHGCYPDAPDKHASLAAKAKWQSIIDAIISND